MNYTRYLKYLKFIIPSLLVIVVLAFSSCSTTKDIADVAVKSSIIDKEIRSGKPLAIITSIKLNDEEIKRVNEAVKYYESFRDKWSNMLRGKGEVATIEELKLDYETLRDHYFSVHGVALSHISEYDRLQVKQLKMYQEQAHALNTQIEELLKSNDEAAAFLSIVDFGLTIFKFVK